MRRLSSLFGESDFLEVNYECTNAKYCAAVRIAKALAPLADGHWVLSGQQAELRSAPANGFTQALRVELFKKLKPLEIAECPFSKKALSLGSRTNGGQNGEMQWLKPVLVGQFEFVEWTEDMHLRHSRFVGLRRKTSTKE
jgi:ATP dependent DNA ligase C terminal region